MNAAKKKVAKKAAGKAVARKPVKKPAGAGRRRRKTGGGERSARRQRQTDHLELQAAQPHMLDGFGGMGEGMSIQIAPDGRRILWLAHESAPKNFTAVDVSDPRKPKVVVQTDLPQAYMRSNSLETCGNIMAVAYQTQRRG